MFERLTTPAREVVMGARHESEELSHGHVGTEHILLALLADGSPVRGRLTDAGVRREDVRGEIVRFVRTDGLSDEDATALEAIGIDMDAVRAKLEEAFGPGALAPSPPPSRYGLFGQKRRHSRFTARARKVLELSLREALRLKHPVIAPEHILLGLIREGEGLAAKIMVDAGVDLAGLRQEVELSLRSAA
jgi:ATP-dependent Clp protease ATP-binding subunit ClpA